MTGHDDDTDEAAKLGGDIEGSPTVERWLKLARQFLDGTAAEPPKDGPSDRGATA